MLVLTRRPAHDAHDPNDTIVLHDKRTGETYEVIVSDVRGDSVRLGIVAPRHVAVDRKEIAVEKNEKQQHSPRILTI